jgi:hypothetical protein
MHNQHAGLSQALAEQRITERHEKANHARLVAGPPRRPRRWRDLTRWRLALRWPGGAARQPADRPHSAN